MAVSKKDILDKTHYGLNIFTYILRKYYPDGLLLKGDGKRFELTKNPFNDDKESLLIVIKDNIAQYQDVDCPLLSGDALDFASMHYEKTGDDLLETLNTEMHLHIGEEFNFYHSGNNPTSERTHHQETEVIIKRRIEPQFSLFLRPITNTQPSCVTSTREVYNMITSDVYERRTEEFRKIEDTKSAKEYKLREFDCVTFSGIFLKREDAFLQAHSGLLTIDFDDIDDTNALKRTLLEDEFLETELMFVSPSGRGIKWIIRIDLTTSTHKDYFEAVGNYLREKYGLEIDKSGGNVSRACFLCYDPNAYIDDRGSNNAKKKFDPEEWKSASPKPKKSIESIDTYDREVPSMDDSGAQSKVEALILKLEERRIDITDTYEKWLNIGFALSDTFGEDGRNFYHRISRFHTSYNEKECNLQYDKCLQSKGSGITLATLFHYATEVDIQVGKQSVKELKDSADTPPTFPDHIFSQVPMLLHEMVTFARSREERDILFLGALGVISAVSPNVFGIYDGKKVYPNLFIFVVAPASSGKGVLVHCKRLAKKIHSQLRDEARLAEEQYNQDLAAYNANKKSNATNPKPQPPKERLLFIPANSSATGVFQLLNDNSGSGLIFETEGDTMSLAFKSEFGDYSDGFRKAFHHENLSFYRRTDREYVEIESPKLSAVLSGTPNQVLNLIPSAEDGLFSRFVFYLMNVRMEWNDVFKPYAGRSLEEIFDILGADIFDFYSFLSARRPVEFRLTVDQQKVFNAFFSSSQRTFTELKGSEYLATIRRLGLIAFRIAMIISLIRHWQNGTISNQVLCEDRDFNAAMEIVKVLIVHSGLLFASLPHSKQFIKKGSPKERFYDALPLEFSRQVYLEVATRLEMKDKTVQEYISSFVKSGLVTKLKHDHYKKSLPPSTP